MKKRAPRPSGGNGRAPAARSPDYDKRVALVLQGGGALGSYQAGVYEALAHADYIPDWVAGISIGAINSALIAGNAPDQRVARLREFWESVTAAGSAWTGVMPGLTGDALRQISSFGALMRGQPGFFAPRSVFDWFAYPNLTSFYDTAALKLTLERLVDFDRINAKETRFSVGAVNVRTGVFAYFDNHHVTIRPEHVMASGALPPGFPPIEIDGEHYWDGGLVSNTPLQYVLDVVPRRSRLTFQVDLFAAYGHLPTTLDEVAERDKDIRYSSRTRSTTDTVQERHGVRYNINKLYDKLPPELKATPEARFLYNFACVTAMDIVQLIYRPFEPQGSSKDYEFSRSTMEARWRQGFDDAMTNLAASPWLAPRDHELGIRVFDVVHDLLVGRAPSPQEPEPKTAAHRDASRRQTPPPTGTEPA